MDWTPEQKQAIHIRDKSIIVSASAGSGKTAVLVNRLLQILSDMEHQVKADSIIVVTFTNDAAAEMKQRLTKAFSEKMLAISRNGQHQEELYDWLLQQRSLLGNAKISTIHAFCFDLIRENAEECGVSAQFKIAESAQEAVYRRNALQTVLERFSKKQREQAELLYSCFCAKDDRKLEQIILGIDKNLNSMAFPDYWLIQAEKICQEENTILLDNIRESFCAGVADAVALAEKSRDIASKAIELVFSADEMTSEETYPYVQQLEKDIAKINHTLQKVKHATMTELAGLTEQEIKLDRLPSCKNSKKKEYAIDSDSQELFKKIRDEYKKIYISHFENDIQPLQFYAEDEQMQKQIIPLLLELTRQYREELFQEKKNQNVLSFDDAEYLVLTKLLGQVDEQGRIHKTEFAKALSEQYQLIMVDEYQDSNNRQDCLFKLLAHHSQNSEQQNLTYGDNIFLVGDVKQSIYTFRKANPENFMNAIQKSDSMKDMETIYLNKNFRSSHGVIDFINALFRRIMTEQCGEVNYSKNEELNFGAEMYDNLDSQYQRTQILFPQGETDKNQSFVLQAECIADTIADMISRKSPVMTSDGLRPCEYKDFCILMRTRRNHAVLAEAFQKRNIPLVCQGSDSFLSLPEIRLIWNLLRIADNPMTDIAMAGVLLSPLYGFTADELAILNLLGKDRNRLYLQVRQLAEQELSQEYSALSQKCALFLNQLEQIRTLADRLPLEVCIQEIYDITDLLSLQSLYENAEQRRENLEIFAQYAQSYREHADLTAQSCLSGWLRYLEHLWESEENEENEKFMPKTASNRQTNSVSVKTIHKAKGLEYPYIFVANLERNFNKSNPKNSTVVLMNEDGLLGMRMIDKKQYLKLKTVAFTYLDKIRSLKEKHEEMRLLYVALTRAKQQLFLVMDNLENYKYAELLANYPELLAVFAKRAGSMQEWILQFLISSGENEHVQQAMQGISTSSALADYIVWNQNHQIQPCETEQEAKPTVLPDETIISQIQKQLAYQYASEQTLLPAKYSVTELSHEKHEIQIHEPAFLSEDEEGNLRKLRGKARGTAIHKMMQFMDFAKAEENLPAELERMQKTGFLTPIETETLELNKLKAFFESDLYHRISHSDKIEKEKQLFVRIAELNLPETSELARNYADTDGIIIGTMDLLFHEPDGWVIVDYKTDKVQEETELLKKYSKQLGLYQKAVELILGEPVKQAYIYYFTKNSTIEVDLSSIAY